jgi:thiamine biosynthesis lipoprotein
VASTPALTRRQFLTFDGSPPAAAGPGSPGAGEGHWIRFHRRIMACRFDVALPAERADWLPAARVCLNLADRLEERLSVFREGSEITRINRSAADGPIETHPAVFRLLQHAAALQASTDGAFDVTAAPLSRCWGFLRHEGRLPTDAAIAEARTVVGMGLVDLDAERTTVRFTRRGVELNLGGIGKGYALDVMAAKLRRFGVSSALLSAGGSSIIAIGDDRGSGWPVDLRPRLAAQPIGIVRLRDAAMATSGAGEQFILIDGVRYGHVIDPRSGWPASGMRSATAITGDAAAADALSTAFLVGGPMLAAQYCDTHPGTLAILLRDGDDRALVFGSCDGAAIEDAKSAAL